MNHSYWDDIPQAYEAEFEALEEARGEYEKAVDDLSITLKKGIGDKLGHTLTLERMSAGFAKHVLRCPVPVGDIEWCQVVAGVVAPWGGPARSIGVAISVKQECQPWDPGSVRLPPDWPMCQANGWGAEIAKAINSVHVLEWVFGPPDSTALSIVQEKFLEFVKKAETLTSWFGGGDSRIRGWVMLKKASARIAALSQQGISKNPWGEMYIVQLNRAGYPPIWVGFDPRKQALHYGHNKSDRYPDLADTFAVQMHCRTDEIGGYPAGLLADQHDLQNQPEDELVERIVAAFRTFVEMTP
jgi:hypothetical protein